MSYLYNSFKKGIRNTTSFAYDKTREGVKSILPTETKKYFKQTNYNNLYNENYKELKPNIKNNYIFKNEHTYRSIRDGDKNLKYILHTKRRITPNLINRYYIENNINNRGSFSAIHILYEEHNNDYYETNYILKYIIKDNKNSNIIKEKIKKELKTYVFNILLQSYLRNNSDDLKYICKILEYGKICLNCNDQSSNKIIDIYKKCNNKSYYCIMENCGKDLSKLNRKDYNKQNILKGLNNIVKIFIECCKAVNVLHKLKYVHNDIKPANFLFYKNENGINIKIIDFGGVKENGSKHRSYVHTPLYVDPTLSIDTHGYITIDKRYDIFSLGITFLEILFLYFNLNIFKIINSIGKKVERNDLFTIELDNFKKYLLIECILENISNKLESYDNIKNSITNIINLIFEMIDRTNKFKINDNINYFIKKFNEINILNNSKKNIASNNITHIKYY